MSDGQDASFPLYWLPAGRQVITSLAHPAGEDTLLWVDFERKTAVRVPSDQLIVGWMAQEP